MAEKKKNIPVPFESKMQVLKVDEDSYNTLYTRKYQERKPYVPFDPRKIIAFIPGTVCDVKVAKGDEVVKGELLCILHAMKMNNELTAPFDGKIKAVFVKPGDHVVKSQVMIELK